MISPALVMWTNEIYHHRARVYREGFRHCALFIWSKDGWYGREYIPGRGEVIHPRVADADDNLLVMLGGNHEPSSTELDKELVKRRTNVLPTEMRHPRYQPFITWYRKRAVCHVMHYLGIKPRSVQTPYDLFNFLSPVEKSPKKSSKIVAVTSLFVPTK